MKVKIESIIFFMLLLFEALFSFLLVNFGILNEGNDAFSWILIGINTIAIFVMLCSLIKKKDFLVLVVLMSAYIVHIILIYYDVYITPIATSDIVNYQEGAVRFFYTNVAIYVKTPSFSVLFMGIFYKIFGIQRILLQHFIGMLVILSATLIFRILNKRNVASKYILIAVTWIAFSPKLILDTCVVHREAFIVTSVAISFALFLKWFESNQYFYFVFSLGAVFFGCLFHAGVIGVAVGYAITAILYDAKKKSYRFTVKSIAMCILLLGVFAGLYLGAGDVLFAKLMGKTFEGMIANTETEKGGSYYSIGGNITNIWQMILYTPIRALYFYCSPMPWDWRGIQDIAAFLVSSLIFGISFVAGIVEVKSKKGSHRNLIIAMLLCMLTTGLIFGWGVKNAGTALRHRNKVICIAASLLAISLENRRQRSKDEKDEYE